MNTQTETEDKLGPIQREWVETLKKYPERQGKNRLGIRVNEFTNECSEMCCLGQGLMIIHKHENTTPVFFREFLHDEESSAHLDTAWSKLGLFDRAGFIKNNSLNHFQTLADMNDQGYTWPQIAEFMENNPEKVFKIRV